MKEKTATQPDPVSNAAGTESPASIPADEIDAQDNSEAEAAEPEPAAPLRRCLVTRESLARETMLRFVLGPDGIIVFDALATLPGRGMWLSASAVVIEQALKRGVFARAAKTQARLPPDLPGRIVAVLHGRLLELIGLARRSGNAIAGFEKGREWLTSGKAGLIVQAIDGSAEERARFAGRRGAGPEKIPVVTALTAAALGKIFGRDHVVHAVVAQGRLARMIEVEAARLAGVAGGRPSGQ